MNTALWPIFSRPVVTDIHSYTRANYNSTVKWDEDWIHERSNFERLLEFGNTRTLRKGDGHKSSHEVGLMWIRMEKGVRWNLRKTVCNCGFSNKINTSYAQGWDRVHSLTAARASSFVIWVMLPGMLVLVTLIRAAVGWL